MTNMSLQARGASFIATKTENNPRDLVIKALGALPGADPKEQFDEFDRLLERAADDNLRSVKWYFFVNFRDYYLNKPRKSATTQDQQHTAAKVADIKRQLVDIVLMELVMPNGKLLRDCTFAECAKFGSWFAKLAKKGKPSQIVGKVLTEKQLRALR